MTRLTAIALGGRSDGITMPAAAVLRAWLDRPGHRSNIENCSLGGHGVGLVGTHWIHAFVTTG